MREGGRMAGKQAKKKNVKKKKKKKGKKQIFKKMQNCLRQNAGGTDNCPKKVHLKGTNFFQKMRKFELAAVGCSIVFFSYSGV